MNIILTLKYISIAAVFLALGLTERVITNPSPSPANIEYQQYYNSIKSKESWSEEENNDRKKRFQEYINKRNKEFNVNELINGKLSFAILIMICSFIFNKYILTKPTLLQAAITIALCFIALMFFVSKLELIVYLTFCGIGALMGKKYNKKLKTDAAQITRSAP